MANPEHVEIVKQRSKVINDWRCDFPSKTLDVSGESPRKFLYRHLQSSEPVDKMIQTELM